MPSNWNIPQRVIVYMVDDLIGDGAVSFTIATGTASTTSISGTAGGVSLTAPQLPLHTHRYPTLSTTARFQLPGPGLSNIQWSGNPGQISGNTGVSDSHSHTATVTSGSVTSPSNIDMRVKYVDTIIVQRS